MLVGEWSRGVVNPDERPATARLRAGVLSPEIETVRVGKTLLECGFAMAYAQLSGERIARASERSMLQAGLRVADIGRVSPQIRGRPDAVADRSRRVPLG